MNRKKFFQTKNLAADKKNYTKVSVVVNSKSLLDAYDKAFYYLEIFRSLLCLRLNHLFELRINDRELKPINKIQQGEYSTLHKLSGEVAEKDTYSFIPDYKEAVPLNLSENKRVTINKSIRRFVNQFNRCKNKHQKTIGKALFYYVNAFDETNKYVSFLRSWMVLEILTDTDQYDILIRRATAMFKKESKAYQIQIMEALRLLRNEFVHKGDAGPEPLYACFQIQYYIHNLIIFFNLRYAGFFNCIEESVGFLDHYSPDLKELEKRKRLIDKAIIDRSKNTKR